MGRQKGHFGQYLGNGKTYDHDLPSKMVVGICISFFKSVNETWLYLFYRSGNSVGIAIYLRSRVQAPSTSMPVPTLTFQAYMLVLLRGAVQSAGLIPLPR